VTKEQEEVEEDEEGDDEVVDDEGEKEEYLRGEDGKEPTLAITATG